MTPGLDLDAIRAMLEPLPTLVVMLTLIVWALGRATRISPTLGIDLPLRRSALYALRILAVAYAVLYVAIGAARVL